MREPLLRIKNLAVSFDGKDKQLRAVRGVSFDLYEGESLALVGESGCGKTITAKTILRLVNAPSFRISEGQILYKGQDLLQLSELQMQKIRGKEIGMIFQDPMTSLNPTMKIGKQIIEGILLHFSSMSYYEAKKKSIELLRLVGIPHPELRFEQYPHELSGGMRQRVMIAIAIAPSPKILIADEPTTALDVTIQAQILELLKEIQIKTRTSILFITHDLSIVSSFCHRAVVMYAGRIVESAPVEKIFRSPNHPYTNRLLQSIPRLDGKSESNLLHIEGAPPDLSKSLVGCAFCPRCDKAMNICCKQSPPDFSVSEKHVTSCWLHDDRVSGKGASKVTRITCNE